MIAELRRNAERLGASGAEIVRLGAEAFLAGAPRAFDIVFLDPPFGRVDAGKLCTLLAAGWLAPEARVYIETGRAARPELPPGWDWLRQKTAGGVRFGLVASGG